MEKKLPNLYVNKIDKNLNNNALVFYSYHKKEVNKEKNKKVDNIVKKEDVEEAISEMFDSPNFVYKMNVTITLKNNDIINKSVIGQVNGKLLTIDDDLIDIADIKEIKF